jgi:Fe-S-cluster containining protein
MADADLAKLGLRLATSTGDLDVQLQVPRGPLRLSALAALAQHLTDLMVEQAVMGEREAGRELSCAAGCGACCTQLVPLSAPEAFVLADHVVQLPAAERDAVIDRFDRAVQTISDRGAMPLLEGLAKAPDQADLPAIAARYFALSIPCPLLMDDSCSAHAHRPLVCRHYNVTSPAEWCADPTQHAIAHVPTPPLMSPKLAQLTAELSGGTAQLIPLPLALDWAEQHAALAMQTWPGVELLGGLLQSLGFARP